MRLHHIGIATVNIDETISFIETISEVRSKSEIVYDALQDASLCMLELQDGSRIELVMGKAVEKFLKKRISLYHTCYEVLDITQEKENFVKNGALIVSDEKEAVLFGNRKVVFLMTKIGLIELVESEHEK